MLYRKPRIGQDISAYCGRCKEERTHTVTAMDGDIVRRVTCSMCGSVHNFRGKLAPAASPDGAAAAPSARARSGGGSRRSSKAEPFSIDPNRPVKSYDMNTLFSTGDVIRHPKFGLGAVENALPPNKIEVRFEEGKKLLLHNMKNFRA